VSGSAYPAALDTLAVGLEGRTQSEDGKPKAGEPKGSSFHSDLHNDANDAITKIEAELGVEPSGAAATVAAALAARQPLDSDLTAIAALSTQPVGRELLTKSTVAAIRSYLEAQFAQGDLFNAKDPAYGAKGDGATDDATALAAALTAAKAVNGTVYLPAGTYITGTRLVLPSNVRLLGAGWTSTILKAKNASNIVVLEGENYESTGIANSAVEQLAIDGNKANNAMATHGIRLQSQNVYFHKVRVINCRGDGFRINLTTETQQEIVGLDNSFVSCRALGCEGYGFYVNAHDTLMVDCEAVQCKETGFYMLKNSYMYYCHSWCYTSGATVTKVGYYLSGDIICVSCVAEGASEKQVQCAGGNNRWIGGEIFCSTSNPNVPLVEFTGELGSHFIDGVYLRSYGTGGALKFTGPATNSMIRAQIFDPESKPAGIGAPAESVMFDVTLGGSTTLGTIPSRLVRQEVTIKNRNAGEPPKNTILLDPNTALLNTKDNSGVSRIITPNLSRLRSVDPSRPEGTKAEIFHRLTANFANAAVLTSGTLYVVYGLILPAGQSISAIHFYSATTAAVTPENQWACLLNSARKVLAVSKDKTTTAWAANGKQTFEIEAAYAPPAWEDQMVYVGLLVKAATVPTLQAIESVNAFPLSQAPILAGTSNTGLSTPSGLTVGSTATAITATAKRPYCTVN
jgi:hypothetical protein